ncbi:MAG: PQQ-dependent sugar dehydrogenase, partial [Bacteroidota bacterium]
ADDSMLPGGRVKVVQDSLLLLATSDENDHNLQSRDTASLSGKWLCFDLEGHPVQASAHLPAPLYAQGVRNAQGLAETDRGALFFCDHGPSNDDELNRLTPGGDYGWPDIRGFCDAPDETPFCTINHKVDPTVAWTPTIAPGSVAYYGHSRYPDLTNSLLLATLKESDLRVLTLNEQHTEVVAETVLFNNQFGRIRDIAVSDDGRIFLATANQIPEDNPYYIPVATQGLTYDVLVEVMVGSEARQ